MANFNKAFNFRGGFQVDTDVLIVRGQNVGIGSTIPDERLVVDGIIQANGLKILSTEEVELEKARAGILTVTDFLDVGIETLNPSAFEYPFGKPQVRITTGIVTSANPAVGVVTYYGDGAQLLNLPTSQWLDIDVGLGFTSIYAQGYVGVATDDPRYEFQVGGVPFDTTSGPFIAAQRGVGIERGDVFASGIISARGEFVGVGSLVSFINADNIAIGSIGSMRYGSVINTEEVYADRFIGIADTAASVTFDAELVFTSGIATDFQAEELIVTGISSLNVVKVKDHLQVGDEATPGNVGDLEVFKNSNANAYIYSLSDSGSANVFIGRERFGGVRKEFGGLRKGFIPGVNITSPEDLDLVNYDIGNLSYYLHAGSGGAGITTGSFRWIYGQTNTVIADLDRFGKLSLNGNSDPTNPTLDVKGSVSTRDINANGKISVTDGIIVSNPTGISTFNGDVSFTGGVTFDNIDIGGEIDIDQLLIGEDPESGGDGTFIGLTSAYIAGVAKFERGTTTNFITNLAAPSFNGDVNAGNIIFSGSLTGPFGFSVQTNGDVNSQGSISIDGELSATSAQLTTLNVNGNADITGVASVDSLESSGDVNGASGNFDVLETNSLTVVGGFVDILAEEITTNTLEATANITTPVLLATTIASIGSSTSVAMQGDLDVAENEVTNAAKVTSNIFNVGEFIVMGGRIIEFDFGDITDPKGTGEMVITLSDPDTGFVVQTVTLPYDEDPLAPPGP